MNMEKASRMIASYLVRKKVVRKEEINICQYGLQVGMETCLSIVCGVVIAVLCSMEVETAVFLGVFFMFRSYAGGLHLNTYLGCLVCSCLSQLGLLLLVRNLSVNRNISAVIIICSFICIWLLAPVQDVNRPLSREEKERFRRKLIWAMFVTGGFAFLIYIYSLGKILFTVAATSLLTVIVLIIGKMKYAAS